MKRLLTLFLLLTLCAEAQFSRTVAFKSAAAQRPAPSGSTLSDGLVAYWKLEEASGTRDDAVGANDLTDINTVVSVAGKIGDAADMEDSTSEYLSSSGTWAQQTGDFTISAWVNCESLGDGAGDGRGVMCCRNSDAVGDWFITIGRSGATGSVQFFHWTSTGNDTDGRSYTSDVITTGSWFHIVCRRSSGTYTIWINNVSQGLTVTGTASGWDTAGFEIGRTYGAAGYYFDGLIDEAGLWSRALSDSEIGQLYNSGDGVALP